MNILVRLQQIVSGRGSSNIFEVVANSMLKKFLLSLFCHDYREGTEQQWHRFTNHSRGSFFHPIQRILAELLFAASFPCIKLCPVHH